MRWQTASIFVRSGYEKLLWNSGRVPREDSYRHWRVLSNCRDLVTEGKLETEKETLLSDSVTLLIWTRSCILYITIAQRIVVLLLNLINVLLLIKVAVAIYKVKQNSDSMGNPLCCKHMLSWIFLSDSLSGAWPPGQRWLFFIKSIHFFVNVTPAYLCDHIFQQQQNEITNCQLRRKAWLRWNNEKYVAMTITHLPAWRTRCCPVHYNAHTMGNIKIVTKWLYTLKLITYACKINPENIDYLSTTILLTKTTWHYSWSFE
jgi:hypothetical protein